MGIVYTATSAKITRSVIDAAWRRRAPGCREVIRDTECRALSLVVNPDAMQWVLSYRPTGTNPATEKRWPTKDLPLGGPASASPDEARLAANRAKDNIAAGLDPIALRQAVKDKAAADRATTILPLLDAYALALPLRPKMRGTGLPSAKHVASEVAQARAAIRVMGVETKPISAILARDALKLAQAGAHQPATVRARYGAASRFFDWCIEEGHLVGGNPFLLIPKAKRPRTARSRQHYLTVPQLAALWKAAGELREAVWTDLVRLLIVIPCRRSELAGMDWSHVDLPGATWVQPGATTKNGDSHRFHLPALALDILKARHRAADEPRCGVVVPAPRSGGAISTFSDLREMMIEKANLSGWRWHDTRRSFASALGEAGLSESVLDSVLNHRQSASRGGVLGVYQKSVQWPAQQNALIAWDRLLTTAIKAQLADDAATPADVGGAVAVEAAP